MHFSKILVTTDFSEGSYEALDIAAYAAKSENAEVRLINVYQYVNVGVASPDIPIPPLGVEYYEDIRKRLQAKLEELSRERMHGQKVIAEVLLTLNSPADTITQYAKQHGSELIIIASKGHTAFKGLFFGSTVQRVLLFTPCPVLVVPVRD